MRLIDALPRARSPFGEKSPSQEESMKVSPSIVDQDILSLINDGTISIIEEEEKTGVITQSQKRHLKHLMKMKLEHLLQEKKLLHSCKEFHKISHIELLVQHMSSMYHHCQMMRS